MQFTTVTFLLFFITVFALYTISRGLTPRNLLLLVSSYVFYGWWDWRYLLLIALSTVVDYFVGRALHRCERPRGRLQLLLLSVTVNLGTLGVFKYYDFFAESLMALGESVGWKFDALTLELILPVGISFYTFQTMSYTIDIYRRQLEPTDNFLAFAVFVAFFPQLVAGPIERGSRMIPQFLAVQQVTAEKVRVGISFVLLGLFTKMVIADNAAAIANRAFSAAQHSAGNTICGTYAFALQIYGDFSGYSNIAIGLGCLLGFRLSQNFNQPYLALSIQDFWRRWHMSLSSWLRDYLYIPLGGNRHGTLMTYRNLMLCMLLGGLWHGAAWTFAVWGLLHGGYLAVERALGSRIPVARSLLGRIVRAVFVFHLVCLAWVFFRADSFDQAFDILQGLARPGLGSPMAWGVLLLLAPLSLTLDLWRERTEQAPILRFGSTGLGLAWAVLILAVLFLSGEPQEFIYFQF